MKLFAVILLLATVAHAAPPPTAFDVREFGATGDGKTSATKNIQATIDAASAAGGGTVFVPAGKYVTGTLWLKSNVTVHIDAGA